MEVFNVESAKEWLETTFPDKYAKLDNFWEYPLLIKENVVLDLLSHKNRLEQVCSPCINKNGDNAGCSTCPEAWFTINVASSNFYSKPIFVDIECKLYRTYLNKQDILDNIKESGMSNKENYILEQYDIPNNAAAVTKCKNYVKNYDECYKNGVGLYIYGAAGNGKTFLVCGVGNALLANGYKVKFISTTSLHNTYKSLMNAENTFEAYTFIEELSEFPGLLILDDIGTEVSTERVNETMYTIVNTRYDLKLPTLFTSNFSIEKLVARYKGDDGIKIVDRILGRSIELLLTGQSYRKKELEKLIG